ncbi:MAG: PucR family transcriptional regulator, partial [Tumebacillaceae bacterium]
MNHFQRVVQSQTFYLAFDGQSLFVPTMTKMIQNEMIELLQQNLFAKERVVLDSGILPISEQKNIIYQPIVAMGQVLACLGVVLYEQEPDEFLFLLLDYTANAIAQLLVRKLFAEERELDIQDRLLDEILQDKIKQEAHIRAQLDIKAEESHPPAYLAAVLELVQGPQHSMNNRDFTFHDLLGVFRSLFYRQGFRTLLRSKGNRLYLLLLEAGTGIDYRKQLQKAIAELKRTCSQTLGRDVQIQYGVSRLSRRYAHAYHHFQEAEQVLSFSSHAISPFFDDLGIYRLLMHVEQGHVIDSFIEDYLGPLLRHDHAHGSQLLLTLRTFLDQHGSKQEAAERLFISRQTLYQRLEKIGELLGDSYLAPEHRICLELALRSHEWVTQAKSR